MTVENRMADCLSLTHRPLKKRSERYKRAKIICYASKDTWGVAWSFFQPKLRPSTNGGRSQSVPPLLSAPVTALIPNQVGQDFTECCYGYTRKCQSLFIYQFLTYFGTCLSEKFDLIKQLIPISAITLSGAHSVIDLST